MCRMWFRVQGIRRSTYHLVSPNKNNEMFLFSVVKTVTKIWFRILFLLPGFSLVWRWTHRHQLFQVSWSVLVRVLSRVGAYPIYSLSVSHCPDWGVPCLLSPCQQGHSCLVLASVIPLHVLDQKIPAVEGVCQSVLCDLGHMGWQKWGEAEWREASGRGGLLQKSAETWLGLCRAGGGRQERLDLGETFHMSCRKDRPDVEAAWLWLIKGGMSQWVSEGDHIFRWWFAVNPWLQRH